MRRIVPNEATSPTRQKHPHLIQIATDVQSAVRRVNKSSHHNKKAEYYWENLVCFAQAKIYQLRSHCNQTCTWNEISARRLQRCVQNTRIGTTRSTGSLGATRKNLDLKLDPRTRNQKVAARGLAVRSSVCCRGLLRIYRQFFLQGRDWQQLNLCAVAVEHRVFELHPACKHALLVFAVYHAVCRNLHQSRVGRPATST